MRSSEEPPWVPVPVASGLTFTSIGSDGWAACGLTESGAAWCWGLNERLELGGAAAETCDLQRQTFPCSLDPMQVSGGHTFTEISMTWHTVCALDEAGKAWCWGDNEFGQLGSGVPDELAAEPQPVLGGHTFVQLAAGRRHTCGLTSEGAIYCWGMNEAGQIGVGRFSPYEIEPLRVFGPRS